MPGTAILDDDLKGTLTSVLDTLIPPSEDGRLPGAGELGLGDAIVERAQALAPLLAQALAAVDELARESNALPFASLDAAARTDVLSTFAAEQPGVFQGLLFQTYAGYYQNARVVAALGLEARPPYPEGHALETGDLSLLEPVRRRSKHYREV